MCLLFDDLSLFEVIRVFSHAFVLGVASRQAPVQCFPRHCVRSSVQSSCLVILIMMSLRPDTCALCSARLVRSENYHRLSRVHYFLQRFDRNNTVERRTRNVFDQGHSGFGDPFRDGSVASMEPASPSFSPQILIFRGVSPLLRQTSAGSYRPSRSSPRCTWSDVLMILIHHSFGVGHPHLSVSRLREAHLSEKPGILVTKFVGRVSKQFIRILLRLLSMSFSSIILPLLVVRVCLARSSSRVSVAVQDAFGVCLTRFAHSSMQFCRWWPLRELLFP